MPNSAGPPLSFLLPRVMLAIEDLIDMESLEDFFWWFEKNLLLSTETHPCYPRAHKSSAPESYKLNLLN